MATRYWVGGSGTWDASSTANWSASSGGSAGASAPTSVDDVIFDAGSDAGTGFTVTVGTGAVCQDFSTGGAGGALDQVMTLAGSAAWSVFGSLTFPATNLTRTYTGTLTFAATTTGKTITTNGVALGGPVVLDGVGGGWTLGSAFTISGFTLTVTNGSFATANFSLTATALNSSNSNIRSITLGSSAVTLSSTTTPLNFSTSTNLTFNAGTSNFTHSGSGVNFNGGGQTFYNVSFTGAAAGTNIINQSNTFNNLSFTTRSATGFRAIVFELNQTINGTLTFGTTNTAIRRMTVFGTTNTATGVGTAVTLTVAAVATLADVDFRDITVAGASSPWSGTRLGNAGNNTNITFAAGTTKYWNLAAGGNWSATAWATGSGGAVNVNNFPLAQDTVIIENTGLNTGATITMDVGWWLGTIDASTRTNAFTLAGSASSFIFGSLTLPSVTTATNTGTWYFQANNSTQNITTNGVTIGFVVNCNGSTNNTVKLIDNLTSTVNITQQQGVFDLNSKIATCAAFGSNNSITRSIAFGVSGKIIATSNSTTVLNFATLTNFSYTGTSWLETNYSGSTGTRTISIGSTAGATASNVMDVYVSAGADAIITTTTFNVKNFNLVGFTGVLSNSPRNIYGGLTLDAGMTTTIGTAQTTFLATSGTHTITSNGAVYNQRVQISSPGATVKLADAFTQNSTSTNLYFSITEGTFDTDNKNMTLSQFFFGGALARTVNLGSSTITVVGNFTAPWNASDVTNLTFNAGTSSIVINSTTSSTGAVSFSGASQTYYNLTFAAVDATRYNISGTNTFNNLTVNTLGTAGFQQFILQASQTVTGTFTISGSGGTNRVFLSAGDLVGTQTITAAAVSTLTDVDFQRITAAGASIPWSGTRLGNCGGNTNINFGAGATKYWSQPAGGNWSDAAWATTSGGVGSATNFPLPQDSIIFDDAGINSGATVTKNYNYNVGSIDFSALTNPITWVLSSTDTNKFMGNVTLVSTMTLGGTSLWQFNGTGVTQDFASAGLTIPVDVYFNSYSGTTRLTDPLTTSGQARLQSNTLNLNGFTLSCNNFYSSSTTTRQLAFGSGAISVTGNNATVWEASDLTNFTYTGTPTVNFTYAGSTGTRTISNGNTAGAVESNAVDFNILAGGDTISFSTASSCRNFYVDDAFVGVTGLIGSGYVYGNLELSQNQTVTGNTNVTTFAATSGTKTINTKGILTSRSFTFDGVGGSWQLLNDLDLGSGRIFRLINGSFDANGYDVTVATVSSSVTNTRTLNLGSGTWYVISVTSAWQFATSTNLTLIAGTSTIELTSSSPVFEGGGLSYNKLRYNNSTSGILTINGSNTFKTIEDVAGPNTIRFESGVTQYVGTFTVNGSSGNLVTIDSTTAGVQATLAKTTGGNSVVSFCSITDSAATPGGYWFAPLTSGNVNGGNNTGWSFGTPESATSGFLAFLR